MLSYPSAMSVSNRALITLTDALRRNRNQRGTRWRRLQVDQQAHLVLAHLRKGETYTDLAVGFGIGGCSTLIWPHCSSLFWPHPGRVPVRA